MSRQTILRELLRAARIAIRIAGMAPTSISPGPRRVAAARCMCRPIASRRPAVLMPPGPSFGKAPPAWRRLTARSFGGSAKKKNPNSGGPMVRLRHNQHNLGEVFFAREAESLMEAWMKEADEILEDEQLLDLVYEQLGRRCPLSRKRGRNATPAEVVLRLTVLKHVRNWSYEVLEREVKANLVYRMFTRIGTETVPDAKTLGRLGRALGSKIVEQIHPRLVEIACQRHLVEGMIMPIDTRVT